MSSLTPSVSTPILTDIFLYARRILKQPNQEDISDVTLGDYLNRFYIYDVPARIQLFDAKVIYSLELEPFIDQYNAPITYLPGGAVIPTYQTFLVPAYVDGYKIIMEQSHAQWMNLSPNKFLNQYQQNGTNSQGPYDFIMTQVPVVRGHRDQNVLPQGTNMTPFGAPVGLLTSNVLITAIDENGNLNVAQDDPTNYSFLGGQNLDYGEGNLICFDPLNPDNPPSIIGTVNYITGAVSVTFPYTIPSTSPINYQCIPYAPGRPEAVFYFDNTFSFRPIPEKPYYFQIDAYYTPAAFLNTSNAVPYRYMTEYLARGLARKVMQDYGDVEQLQFYEPMFREQETYVLRKTYRQISNSRVATIYQNQTSMNSTSHS